MKEIKSSIFFCITLLCMASCMAIIHSCTVSFHNISTNGTPTDISDDDIRIDLHASQKMTAPHLKLTGPAGPKGIN